MRALLCLLLSSPAWAHVGASPAVADFSSPAGPVVTAGTDHSTVAPFVFADADQAASVAWSDGDVDPTGHFTFYAVAGEPHYTTDPAALVATGLPLHEVGSSLPASMWTSCSCTDGSGISCPDAGVRDCRNGFQWDTSAVPEGAWWIVAVNNDPPYFTYSAARAPVVVHHGGDLGPPPSVIVVRPGGTVGNWDSQFTVEWLARGHAPLSFALSYGPSGSGTSPSGPGPPLPLALTPVGPDATGVWSADWDLRALPSKTQFYVAVTVTDADGRQTTSASRDAVTVFHAPDAGVDLAVARSSGCDLEPGEPTHWPWLLALGVTVWLVIYFRRRP